MFNPLTGIRDIMWAFSFNIRFFGLVYIKLALDMINIKSVLKEFAKFLCLLCDVLLSLSRPYNVVLHPMHCNARCVRMFWSCSSSTSTLCLSESSSLGKTWIKFLSNFQVCCKITKFSAHLRRSHTRNWPMLADFWSVKQIVVFLRRCSNGTSRATTPWVPSEDNFIMLRCKLEWRKILQFWSSLAGTWRLMCSSSEQKEGGLGPL